MIKQYFEEETERKTHFCQGDQGWPLREKGMMKPEVWSGESLQKEEIVGGGEERAIRSSFSSTLGYERKQ